MGMEEVQAVVPGIPRASMRDLQEEGTDHSGNTGAPQDADHAGEHEGPADHAEPREPDGAV